MRAWLQAARGRALIAGLIAGLVGNARAQPPPEPAAEAPRALETVTVTATKVVQTLEKAPASITVLGEEFLRERSVAGFQEASDYSANVTMNVSGSAGQFVIRGLGTPDTNQGFDPSVGTVVDGVYYGRANFLSVFFNDTDRYEVLRGPQGTLFGKNSTAGLFNVVTNKPGPRFGMDASVLNRGFGDFLLQTAINLPVTDDLGFRVSGSYRNGDTNTLFNTRLKRVEENEEVNSTRLRARWATDNGVSLDATVLRGFYTQNNNNFQLFDVSTPMLDAVRAYDPDFEPDLDARRNSADFPGAERSRITSTAATLEFPVPDFGGMSNLRVTAISAYAESLATARNIDADFTPIPFISNQLVEPSRYAQVSQEIRFTGAGKDFFGYGHGINFIAGVYLARSQFGTADLFSLEDLAGALAYCTASRPEGPPNCNENLPAGFGGLGTTVALPLAQVLPLLEPTGLSNQNVRTRLAQNEQVFSGFGQVEYSVRPQWAVIAGLHYGAQNRQGVLSALASSPIVQFIANSENHTTPLRREEGDYSPKLGLRYSPARRISHYATWSRGFKSGGFNGLPLRSTENEFEPERASSYEVGSKARLDEGRMRLSGSAFYTTFSDLQVSTFLQNRFLVLNAGSAVSRGGELDFQWLPRQLPFLHFRSSVGFADARYRNYPNGPCFADAVGCTQQDLSGKRLPYAPRWTAAVAPNVFFPLGNGLLGSLGVDWIYRSSRFLDVDIDPRKLQGATNVYNAFFVINDASRKWAVNLGVRNLTDVRAYDQIISQPLAPGNFAASGISEPRLFTQSISYTF